jgi:protein-tyrosine phosphatase
MACTPHLRASALRHGVPARHDGALAALQAAAPVGLSLLHGWEILLDEPGVPLAGPTLALGDSRAVLVEWPRGPSLPPNSAAELRRIRDSGVVPVLAHPERYPEATPAQAHRWREAGAVLQGDATIFRSGGSRGEAARALLAAGALDLLASDNHGDTRTLAGARDALVAAGALDAAALLTAENPARVLAGLAPLPVPPVRHPGRRWPRLAAFVRQRIAPRPSPGREHVDPHPET